MVVKNRLRRDPVLLCQLHRPCDSLSILVAPSCCVFNGVAIYLHSCSLSFMSESESGSCSVMSNSLWPHGLLVHGILQARILEWVAFPFSRGSSQPRDWTQVSRTAGGFLPAEPQRKPKNTGVGSLSLLPTQESNRDLHCRQILYQLSYQGSPGLMFTHSLLYNHVTWNCLL